MTKLSMIFALVFWCASSQAGWVLEGVTYHGYCPPAAIRSGLCKQGGDFDADDFVQTPRDLGIFKLNQLTQTEEGLAAGSSVRVPYLVRGQTRWATYRLLDIWQDLVVCDLLTAELVDAVTHTWRPVTLMTERDGCELSIRTDWTEPTNYPSNATTRDATLRFRDTGCE